MRHSESVSALKSVQMLVYTSKMAKNLMMDLLDLAQVENNSFRVVSAPFSLLQVIEDAFLVVSHIAAEKKVKLLPPSLDEESAKFFTSVEGDAGRFFQILVNFLSNALKFSAKNSEIKVNLKVLEKHLTL